MTKIHSFFIHLRPLFRITPWQCPWCHCHACLCPAMLIGFKLISNSQGRLVMDFYENIKSFIKKICNETEGKLVGEGEWASERLQKRNKLLYVSFWREWGARDTSQSPFGNSSIYCETSIFVWKEKYLFKLSGCFEMKHWESAEHSCGAAKKNNKTCRN